MCVPAFVGEIVGVGVLLIVGKNVGYFVVGLPVPDSGVPVVGAAVGGGVSQADGTKVG